MVRKSAAVLRGVLMVYARNVKTGSGVEPQGERDAQHPIGCNGASGKPRYRVDLKGVANAIQAAYYRHEGVVADGTDIWEWCALHAVVHLAATHQIHFAEPGQRSAAPPKAGT